MRTARPGPPGATPPSPKKPNECGYACVKQLIRQRRNVSGGVTTLHPAGYGHPLVRPRGERWFCLTVVICLPRSGQPPMTP
jgi:hypothetical protein